MLELKRVDLPSDEVEYKTTSRDDEIDGRRDQTELETGLS